MANWAINQLVAPGDEPVTLAELKLQTHITHTIQDSTLTSYLLAGRIQAEEFQRVSYMPQTWELTLDCLFNYPIYLLRGPVTSLVSVKLYDTENNETVMDNSDFYLETSHKPAKLVLNSSASWPSIVLRDVGGVKIEYETGYADATKVPANVKHAIILFASFADDNRAAEEAEIPRAFWDLLRPTRIETNEPW
jgi:uncharacterized phiE125 gp8 family phage protein